MLHPSFVPVLTLAIASEVSSFALYSELYLLFDTDISLSTLRND
jgi:hypothetical protein